VQGPFGDAPQPTQGYQLALTPRQIYRLGIAATDAACVGSDGKPFAQLAAQRQDAILSALEHGTLAFEELPAKTFFEMLLQNTVEGFFSDPIHGGNREMIGWKLVGFPGAAGAYVGAIEQHGKPFAQAPVSLAELEGHHH
jgi:gluconate 2-dehydrogenase gamma chain